MTRLENLWVTPVSGTRGKQHGNVGKPRCFNGFQISLNRLRTAFWIPVELTWDFKVCAAPRSNGHFEGGGWLPTGVPSAINWNRPSPRPAPFRPAGRRRTPLVLSSQKGFCFGFQRVAGAKPPRVQEGFLPPIRPIHPRIPLKSHLFFCI